VITHLWGNDCAQRTLCTIPPEPWSPGRARNFGAAHVRYPVIVFNDADTICPAAQIREAVQLAGEAPGLVFAYDLYVRLNEWATQHVIDEGREPDFAKDLLGRRRIINNSGSMGCVAISRESFAKVGGFDEAYEGWGYEDIDFARRCAALWPLRRVSGPVYHLWHGGRRSDDSPLDSDTAQVRANFLRWCGDAA